MEPTKAFLALLPTDQGLLPKWQLIVTLMALFNSVQNFVTLKLTRRLYSHPRTTVTPLQARTFAAWTLTSAVVRGYAAFHIHDKTVYDMALFTYLIAFGHFTSELFIFRTTRLNGALLGPLIVSTGTLVWMLFQYDFYVRA